MKAHDDSFPLEVAKPAKAEWTPPSKESLEADDASARRKKQAQKNAKKKK